MKSITGKQTNENAQEYWNYNHHHKVKTPLLTCLGKDFIYSVQFIIFINNFTEFQAHIWIWWSCRITCQRAKKLTYLKQCPLTLIFIGPGRMLCGNDYFIICHALSLFQRENFKPCSALQKNFVRTSTETVLSLLRTWWQISNTQNKNPQEGKNQARCLTQDLKSTVDACCTSQTGKSTTNAEWTKMSESGKQLGQESSEMVLIQTHQDQGRSTTLFCKILWYFLVL